GARAAQGLGPRGHDQLRWVSVASKMGRAADGVARRTDPVADELDVQARRQLRRRDHPAHGRVEGAVLPPYRQEHAVDEGDAGASAAGERAPQQVPEGRAGAPARNARALQEAQGEPDGWLPADGRAGPDLLRALPSAVGIGRAPEFAVSVFRA